MSETPETQSEDLDAYQNLARHIILQALDDVNARDDYETQANRAAAEHNRSSAVTFFKGHWFKEICEGIGIPHSSAKRAAFK